MKRTDTKIPLLVLAQVLGVGLIGAIPILFVAINQIRRACGDRLFGSREHFCASRELWTWLLSLPHWIQLSIPVVALASFMLVRRFALKIAS